MAHIREVMAMGVASPLARMLGSNRLMTVLAAGSSQDDATPLIVNYALIQSFDPGAGVRLGPATGAALTALYNSGPSPANLYPAEDDAFNDQPPDFPVILPAGQVALCVPSIDRWIAVEGSASGGVIPEAPSDGAVYGRGDAAWTRVVPLAGGAMTGPLLLSGDPVGALGAATKQYVDGQVAIYRPPPVTVLTASGAVASPGVTLVNNTSGAPVALNLAPALGLVGIKDSAGNANLYPITVTFAGGIDGQPSTVLAFAYQWVWLVWGGAGYSVLG